MLSSFLQADETTLSMSKTAEQVIDFRPELKRYLSCNSCVPTHRCTSFTLGHHHPGTRSQHYVPAQVPGNGDRRQAGVDCERARMLQESESADVLPAEAEAVPSQQSASSPILPVGDGEHYAVQPGLLVQHRQEG